MKVITLFTTVVKFLVERKKTIVQFVCKNTISAINLFCIGLVIVSCVVMVCCAYA